MIERFLAWAGLKGANGNGTGKAPFYRPYRDSTNDFFYNLLFCDNVELFRKHKPELSGAWFAIFADLPDRETLERIGNDLDVEGRIRALAFNRLRAAGISVPRRRLLGTIIETPIAGGLDALAAFDDGGLRYINHSGKLLIIEEVIPALQDKIRELLRASQILVNRIGPWDRPRLPPPSADILRMTFLVSDGLYFCQGPRQALFQDRFAQPVLIAGALLLQAATQLALTRQPARL